MSITNRTVTLEQWVWADGSPDVPTLPTLPVPYTTYAKSNLSQEEVEAAWGYAKVVASNVHNELLNRITNIVAILEKRGILVYRSGEQYENGSVALADDGLLYQAQTDTTNDPSGGAYPTEWRSFLTTSHTDDLLAHQNQRPRQYYFANF